MSFEILIKIGQKEKKFYGENQGNYVVNPWKTLVQTTRRDLC